MNSRERVVAALNHQEPDRVPIDFGTHFNNGVSAVAYNRLKRRLGIESPTYMRYMLPFLAAPDLEEGREVVKLMGSDVLPLPRYIIDGAPSADFKPWKLKDGSQVMVPGGFNPVRKENGDLELVYDGIPYFRMPRNGFYFDRIYCQLGHIETRKQLEEIIPVILAMDGLFGITDIELKKLSEWGRDAYHNTDYAILGDPYLFSMYHMSLEVFGYEKFFMMMASDPDLVHAWMEAFTEAFERFFERYLEAVGEYLQVLLMWDDYGTQTGLQISMPMFRELFKPYVTRVLKYIRRRAPHLKIMLHACGSVAPMIGDFIEMGFDALNPVQTTARNMEPEMLKREFGSEMTFWGGGVSAQTTLLNGTVDDIRNEVREKILAFKPGGGYVFTTDHDIQEHVSPEKILAIYRAAQEFRDY